MSTNVKTRVHVRWMIMKDRNEVMAISDASMPAPYTEDHLLSELRRKNCIGMVAELSGIVVGFMIYVIEKHEIHLEEIAVRPDYRSQSIGSQMIDLIISKKLSLDRRSKITLYCRELNLRAQQFCRSQGFMATNVLRGYYNDTNEDAYFFEYKLPSESK